MESKVLPNQSDPYDSSVYSLYQISQNTKFYISFVYGLSQIHQRIELWDELAAYQPLHDPWCVIGDFNAIMYKEDRIGVEEVLMADIKDMRSFLESCELQELRCIGPYYS